jgi:uncharacterized protein YukE
MSDGLKFNYEGVQKLEDQVTTTGTEVNTLFSSLDESITSMIGSKSFHGQSAAQFLDTWNSVAATFKNYTSKITDLCEKAKLANGEYQKLEDNTQVTKL